MDKARECSSCHEIKRLVIENFTARNGYFSRKCRKCVNKQAMEYHFKNRVAILIKLKEYQRTHKEQIRDQRRRHYLVHREEINNRSIAWSQKNREHVLEYRRKNYFKVRARTRVNNAIKRGVLIKQPCENCGAKKTQAHHEDYTKPLDVRWLCPPCHSAHHRGLVPLHQIAA